MKKVADDFLFTSMVWFAEMRRFFQSFAFVCVVVFSLLFSACRANKEVAENGLSGAAMLGRHFPAQMSVVFISQNEGAACFQKDMPTATTLKKYLHLSRKYSFRIADIHTDNQGYLREMYHQYYKGIRVDGSEIRTVFLHDSLCHASGACIKCPNINITKKISKDKAASISKETLQAVTENIDTDLFKKLNVHEETVICMNMRDLLDLSPHIAYKVNLSHEASALHETIYIDARTGQILNQFSNILYNVRLADFFPKNEVIIQTENPLTDLPWLKAIVERFRFDTVNQIKIWECSYLDSLKGYEVSIKSPTEHKSLHICTYILYNGKGECICSQSAGVDDEVDYFISPLHFFYSQCQKIELKRTKRIYQNH